MAYLGIAFVIVAALLHGYIFVMESLTWTSARTRATFGLTEQQAAATRPMAFNQGFYNLFLAITALAGAVAILAGHPAVGLALVLAGAGSMVLAGLVLLLSDRTKARPALIQATPPLIGIVLLLISWFAG